MKELSIEEKAKRYESSLERCRELYNEAKANEYTSDIEDYETIFPELKESEDEKVRKTLLRWLQSNSYTSIAGMPINDVIAWLENIPYTIDHEKREGFRLGYKAGLEKQGEQKPINETDEEIVEVVKDTSILDMVEQKPAWSEDNVKKPNGGIVMEDFDDGNGFYKVNLAYLNEEQVGQIEKLVKRWDLQPKGDEDESIISDLLDYFDEDKCLKHEVNDIVKWLKTIKPQQKGWGENEIKMLDNLIKYLDGKNDLLEEIKRTYITWLKSLKDRIGGNV